MVYQPTQPSKVEKKHKRSKVVQVVLDILTLVLVAGATYAIFRLTAVKPENRENNNPEVISKVPTDEDEEDPMWLNRTLSSWAGTFSRDFAVGVEVYDLNNDAVVGELTPERQFDGQVASALANDFQVAFATGGQTSARELTEVLKVAFKHVGMSEEDWASYKEKLLNQEQIFSKERCRGYCEVRNGLPVGFKDEKVKVYNENYMDTNGSFYEVYRDAAIVEFDLGNKVRSFAVALVARGFSYQDNFQKLGEMLEKAMLTHFDNEI